MFDPTSRQIRNVIWSLFIGALFTTLLPIPYAWSIYGGKESNANPIVVALIRGQFNTTSGCSGALVAPQIIFTAAHCLTGDPKSIWIPSPGSDLRDTKSLRIQAEDFLIPEGFSTKSFPYDNDFGIIVLKYPFPNVKMIEWKMENADSHREEMLSAFVIGTAHPTTALQSLHIKRVTIITTFNNVNNTIWTNNGWFVYN